MSEENEALHEDWLRARCPNDAGDDHAWGWITNKESGRKDIFWLHRCNGRLVLGTINTSIHTMVSENPLHVEPSILCSECGDHGYIHDGAWRQA